MESRKLAIIEALICKANTICDAHLKISSLEIPPIFRNGLYFDETLNNSNTDKLNDSDNLIKVILIKKKLNNQLLECE